VYIVYILQIAQSIELNMATSPLNISTTTLPLLPGYRSALEQIEHHRKPRYHKTHVFAVKDGIRTEDEKGIDMTENGATTQIMTQRSEASEKTMSNGTQEMEHGDEQTKYVPQWIAYDRRVLRFQAFFKEAVPSSQNETWRVRKCTIYYYLEDDSMQIAEPKVENSGITQGVFVKRHKIPKQNGERYDVHDLAVGKDITLYGRTFHIVDADAFTRAFYKANDMELGPAEEVPTDNFGAKQTQKVTTHNKMMHPFKEFMEARLGRPVGQSIPATQQFLINDGKVLRFFCKWDDASVFGERRPYILHYHLADSTVEVLEVAQPNSGRDPFPSLLRRQKLPKEPQGSDVSRIGARDVDESLFYHAEDFRVGGSINVYGRKLDICGADDFTKNYYITNYGLTADDFKPIDVEESKEQKRDILPPPHTGFGKEDDSLGSFLYLMPKVPKQDYKKLMENDGISLRFLAKFVNPSKIDRDRRFVITFYMANDSISVFERPERNSGFNGGKFLERDWLKNPETGAYYQPSDFFVGARIILNHFDFEIIDVDEYTKKFIEQNPHLLSQHAASATDTLESTQTHSVSA